MPRKSKKGEINLHIIEGEDKKFPAITIEDREEESVDEKPQSFIYRKQTVLIIALAIVLILGAAYLLKSFIRNSYQSCLETKIEKVDKCETDLREQAESFAADKIRMSDATNILLSLQEYNFNESKLPQSLGDLSKGYYAGNLNDPETKQPYFYQKKSAGDYVLCFYLSTGVWGTNTDKCPKKEDYAEFLEGLKSSIPEAASNKTVTVLETPFGWLNVRQGNSKATEIIGKVYTGESFKVLAEKDNWVQVELKSPVMFKGEQINAGWLSKDYLKEG